MDIFQRNPVHTLQDVVFADDNTRQLIMGKSVPEAAINTLFHGPAGSGKTTLCQVLGKTLVGKGYETDVFSINVSDFVGKNELTDQICDKSGFGALNELGKIVIILEELDGALVGAQKALKDIITNQSSSTLFLATTNDADSIIDPILDRFDTIHINVAPPEMWSERAVQVLANEQVTLSRPMAEQLVRREANLKSGRQVMRCLDRFAQQVKAANVGNRVCKLGRE